MHTQERHQHTLHAQEYRELDRHCQIVILSSPNTRPFTFASSFSNFPAIASLAALGCAVLNDIFIIPVPTLSTVTKCITYQFCAGKHNLAFVKINSLG